MPRKLDYHHPKKPRRPIFGDKLTTVLAVLLTIAVPNGMLIYDGRAETGDGKLFVAWILVPLVNVPLLLLLLFIGSQNNRLRKNDLSVTFLRTAILGSIFAVLFDNWVICFA